MSEMKDIYECEVFNVWSDDDLVFLNMHSNAVTLCLTEEEWDELKGGFRQMLKSNVVEIAGRSDN